jgi:5-methyltetrahydropteroyltriglutamate--homocysteine methyltransferase
VQARPSGDLLHRFIEPQKPGALALLGRGAPAIGVHTCPGGDRDSTHSADIDYAELLPRLFELRVGNFYVALAGEVDRQRVLQMIRRT